MRYERWVMGINWHSTLNTHKPSPARELKSSYRKNYGSGLRKDLTFTT
jgi:hypothetical protein